MGKIQSAFWQDGMALWQHFLQNGGESVKGGANSPADKDRRFAAKQWQEDPFFDLIPQSLLLTSKAMVRLVDTVDGIDPRQKEKLRFATKAFVDALRHINFALTTQLVLVNIKENGEENLLRQPNHMQPDTNRANH